MSGARTSAPRPVRGEGGADRHDDLPSGRRAGPVLLAALAPTALLALDPGGWFPFGPVKWWAVSVLVPAGAGLLLTARPVRVHRNLTLGAVVLLVWMAVAAATGLDPLYAWTGTPERHLGVWTWALLVAALVAGQVLDPDRDGPVVAWGLALAGAGVGLVAVAEGLGWEPDVLDVATGRSSGTTGSPAYLGAAAALLLPVTAGVAADARLGRPLRITAGAGVPMLLVAWLGAGARAAWFGTLVAIVAVAWTRRQRIVRLGTGVLVGGGVAVLAMAVVAVVATPVGPRAASLLDPDAPGGAGRLDEWRVAGRVITGHPLAGVGPEGYRIAFAEGVDAAYEREHGRDPLPDRAHSGPLDVALAGGLPALAVWVAGAVIVGRAAVRVLRTGRPWLAGVAAGLVAHGAGQVLLFPTAELEPVAWLLAGIVVTAAARTDPPPPVIVPRAVPAALAVLTAVALVAGGLGVAADRRAAAAARALATGDTRGAVAAAADATALRPDILRLHLLEARARLAADEGTLAALAAVDDALTVSPRDPVAAFERADLLVARARATAVPDHADTARREVTTLLRRDPVDARLWLLAGSAAHLGGDRSVAADAWRRAERLAPRSAAPLVNLTLLHLEAGDREAARATARRALARDPDDPRAREAARLLEGGG